MADDPPERRPEADVAGAGDGVSERMGMFVRFSLLGLIVGAVAVLAQRYPAALESPDTLAYLVFLGVILLALLFGGGLGVRMTARQAVLNLSLFAAIFVGLVLVYDNRSDLRQTALRAVSALQPGHAVMLSEREAVLTRGRGGHFTAHADINGERVHMLVDTGSTDVALPFNEARRLGIEVDALVFDRPVMTANGRAYVASVLLDQVRIGGIALHRVQASVAEPGRLGGALLGMSFLSRLSEFSFRGDKLILRE